jgi:hypothetical protein
VLCVNSVYPSRNLKDTPSWTIVEMKGTLAGGEVAYARLLPYRNTYEYVSDTSARDEKFPGPGNCYSHSPCANSNFYVSIHVTFYPAAA